MDLKKVSNTFVEHAGTAGNMLNGVLAFFDSALKNTGKLLSVCVVVFTMTLVGIAFFGAINNVRSLSNDELSKMTGEQVAAYYNDKRNAYISAITAVSAPLATLAGILPVVVSLGLIFKKRNENQGTSEETAVVVPNVPPTAPPS